jgi:hypothetical protein
MAATTNGVERRTFSKIPDFGIHRPVRPVKNQLGIGAANFNRE